MIASVTVYICYTLYSHICTSASASASVTYICYVTQNTLCNVFNEEVGKTAILILISIS